MILRLRVKYPSVYSLFEYDKRMAIEVVFVIKIPL